MAQIERLGAFGTGRRGNRERQLAPLIVETAGAADVKAVRYRFDIQVNAKFYTLEADSRTTLLDLLRDTLRLTGTKIGCNRGTCGACTVHLDGRPALSCLMLAVMAADCKITTIEGMQGPDGALHPVQRAFAEFDALQCGYCTPGQIMSAAACFAGGHASSDASVREFMSGNLCRCAAYPNIVAAVRSVAEASR